MKRKIAMPDKKKNIKNELKKTLNALSDTVDLDSVNKQLKDANIEKLDISKKTLMNISKWVLDGKSEFEIRQNLELSINEWTYLKKVCPAVDVVLAHSTAFAEVIVGATLLQTAIGGKIIKKKVPLKVKEYDVDDKGRSIVVGEHYEMVEIEEETQPNPYLLKFLAENKLSEQFSDRKKDNSKEMRSVIDAMSEDELTNLKEYSENK